jgi:2-keto-4-pentenoate hydratase/2-oxohepta-3-ene-1,7-dioic acid hydratase in catechol pathway
MRLARIRLGTQIDFAVQDEKGAWVSLASLGVEARDTPELIAKAPEVTTALTAGRDVPGVGDVELLAPVVGVGKMMAVGLNYLDHIRETNAKVPERPIVFAKYPNSITAPYEPIVVDPTLTEKADYEAELAVIIGRRTRSVSEAEALEAIFGYCVANDVSARDWQSMESQFLRSKSLDTFCPIGPWITTTDHVADPQALRIWSQVNGERRQDSSTKEMLFPIARLVAFIAEGITLDPGDVILTGTPHGVGVGMKPPRFLNPGDVVACEIEGLGRIENPIVGPG